MMTRRQILQRAMVAGFGAYGMTRVLAHAQAAPLAAPDPAASPAGPFVLPALPYAYDALEPYIDAETMRIHHDKHHAAYVANLNKAVAGYPELQKKSVEQLIGNLAAVPEDIRTAVRNNGGGHYNHSLFWKMMRNGGGGAPPSRLADALAKQFGSVDAFQEKFANAGVGQFGSGWAWLTATPGGELAIEPLPNQDSPLSSGRAPLLGIDVWEHAYYLKYQHKRADYIAAWFHVVNWDDAHSRYQQAIKV